MQVDTIKLVGLDPSAFWAKVDKSGDCWVWTGSFVKGYGQVYLRWDNAGRKGHMTRRLLGEASPHHRLDWVKVRTIRERHGAGETMTALGHEFGINRSTVAQIATGRTWKEVA